MEGHVAACKNTSLVPLDVGGRLLAVGEVADLDDTTPDVGGHLTDGRLTRVQVAGDPGPDPHRPGRKVNRVPPPEES